MITFLLVLLGLVAFFTAFALGFEAGARFSRELEDTEVRW